MENLGLEIKASWAELYVYIVKVESWKAEKTHVANYAMKQRSCYKHRYFLGDIFGHSIDESSVS